MNTPAHLLIGAAVMGRKGQAGTVWAAFAGSLLPDLSLYLLGGWALFVAGIPPQVVFGELYYSATWQLIFSIDNSFFVWGILLAFALWRKSRVSIALTGAALLHLVLDLPLHHDDGRAHFWPLTDWVFQSPLSYWDRAYGSLFVAPVAAFIAFLAGVLVIQRDRSLPITIAVLSLVLAEFYVLYQWLFLFGQP